MTFKKGEKYPNQGKRGPSKSTKNAREAIAALVEGNMPRMQNWLDQIAEDQGPIAAWKCMLDVIEYHIPKLQRTEVANADGKAFRVEAAERVIVDSRNPDAPAD